MDPRLDLSERPVSAGYECACCHLQFTGMGRLRLCGNCLSHRGGASMRLDKEHVNSWKSYAEQLRQEASEASVKWGHTLARQKEMIETRDTEILELREAIRVGIDALPAEVIASYVQGVEVTAAHGARNSAFRRRDAAMRVIWRMDQLHRREVDEIQICACGSPNCDVEKVLSPFVDDLFDWESHEKQRLGDEKQDGLPDEHPAVRKAARRGRHTND